MSSSREGGPPRRRESRSGTRKVASLSAEQLERKRANDREAQRSIRQRTKEHIEHLENQVAILQAQVSKMRPRNEQFNDLLRQNAALQDEIARLKHQLAGYTGRQGFAGSTEQTGAFRSGWDLGEGPNTGASSIPTTTNTMLASHYPAPSHSSAVARTPSALSVSSRSPHPHEWQQSFSSTRSSSLGEPSDAEYSARMEPYMEGQLQHSSRMVAPALPLATPQMSFGSTASPSQPVSGSSFSHVYPVGGQHLPPGQRGDGLESVPQSSMNQPAGYMGGHRTMPRVSAPAQSTPAQPYQSSNAPYQTHPGQPPQRDPSYPYPWNPPS